MDHDIREIPNPEEYSRRAYSTKIIKNACYVCGLWIVDDDDKMKTSGGMAAIKCETTKTSGGMAAYQAGGVADPFAGYREPYGFQSGETRPGLVREVIDRSAYDEFMKGL